MTDATISGARASQATKEVVNTKKSRRPVFSVSWDPRLPSINALTKKHWRVMIALDPYLKEVFPEPPFVAYGRQTNIQSINIFRDK